MPRLLLPALILTLLAGCATGPSPAPTPALPDSTLGRIAAEWLAAVNARDDEAIERFAATRFSERALREQSAADRVAFGRKLRAQSGGLDLVEVSPPAGPRPLAFTARTRRGERYVNITMGLDRDQPETLAGLGVDRAAPPAAVRERDWPAGARSEAQKIVAIRREIDRRAAEGTFSGVVLIGRGDEILLHEARGYADREARIPNRLDTRFHLASVSKMFAAAAIAQLVREGKLSFESTILDVLPDYPNREIASKVTVHQLLTHTAGLGTFFNSPGFVRGRSYESEFAQIEVFRDEPLSFEPGKRWQYSNAGYAVLGAMVERLSGRPYVEELRERIFRPLGMARTHTPTANEGTPDIARFYQQSKDDPLGLEPFVPDDTLLLRRPTGFGEGYSAASDLFRFARALRTGALLGPAMTATVMEPRVDTDGRERIFWSYGLQHRRIEGGALIGHTGGGRADVEMLRDTDYTIVILTNALPPTAASLTVEIAEFLAR